MRAQPDPDGGIVEPDQLHARGPRDDAPLRVDGEEGARRLKVLGPEREGLRGRRRLEAEELCVARGFIVVDTLQLAPCPGAAEGAEFPERSPACAT